MRKFIYALPLATVLFVAFTVFVVGAPRPFVGARVLGGPTEGQTHLVWRVLPMERIGQVEDVASVRELTVEATTTDGRTARWAGDPEGGEALADLRFAAPVRGPLSVRVGEAGRSRPLAEGEVSLDVAAWREGVERRGGWLEGNAPTALRVRLAPARGALAVPFRDALVLDVRDERGPIEGASVELSVEACTVHAKAPLVTDAGGRARVDVTPLNHAAPFTATARTVDGREGRLEGALPIVPGAIDARITARELRVVSPIERDVAWLALVTESGRLGGGRLALTPDGRGGAVATYPLPDPMKPPVWAVVSSEHDMASMALIGWPLFGDVSGEPPRTFAPRDRLLLDGLVAAHALDQARRSRARWLAVIFCAAAAGLVGLGLWHTARSSAAQIAAHLERMSAEESSEERSKPAQGGTLLAVGIAVLCVALGFTVIAVVAMFRVG